MDNQLSTGALAVIAAAGGVGALLAGLVAAFVNWQSESRRAVREHQTWLREQKYAAYSEFAASARVLSLFKPEHVTRGNKESMESTLNAYNQCYYSALLLLDDGNAQAFTDACSTLQYAQPDADKEALVADILAVMRADLLNTVPAS